MLDTSFATNGLGFAFNCEDGNTVNAVAPVPGGAFVAGGSACGNFAVARFTSGGALDTTFGVGGKVIIDGGMAGAVTAVVVQPDGQIVAIGSADPIRLTAAGAIDPGYRPFAALEDAGFAVSNRHAVPLADGRILVPLFMASNGEGFCRITTAGEIDSTFADGGCAIISDTSLGFPFRFQTAAQRADGRLLVSGIDISTIDRNPFITQLTAGGGLDTTFGSAGVARLTSDAGTVTVTAMKIQPDDKLVVALSVGNGGLPRLFRLSTNGTLDSSFGPAGEARPSLAPADSPFFSGVEVLASGKILAVGATVGLGERSLLISRFLSSGEVDPSFGTNGSSVLSVGARKWSLGNSILATPSRYVIAGEAAKSGSLIEGALIGIVP